MIPSSVRRVVGAAPQSSPVVSSLAATLPLAGRSYNLKSTGPQRRYSSSKAPADDGSSKPSAPNNGSSNYASQSSAVTSPSEKRKRKAKDTTPAPPKLPSVPSTRHIKDEALALSTFFALHRPISVTQLLPKSVSTDAFAEIFSHRVPSVNEVLSTLSQTVQNLENPQAKLKNANGDREQQQHRQREATAAEANKARTIYERALAADGDANFQYQLDTMTGQFQPFTPPPAPLPITDADAAAAAEEMAAAEQQQQQQSADMPQTRVYKALVTIEETVDADGVLKVVAHSPQVLDERSRQPRSMYAISVKRQRKLKMKKKKYKKLQRKTRNIRRKLDRL